MKKRTLENEDLILALKVAWRFTSTFGSDMSDVVNTVIEDTLEKYGEDPKRVDRDAIRVYDEAEEKILEV